MSSHCQLARLCSGFVVRVQVSEDGSGEVAFEAAQRFGGGVAFGEAVPVVGLAQAVEADLGDSDAVQGG
jgi:hypothetical protein